MAAFIDGGRTVDRDELVEHRHLVLSVRRRDRAGARSDAARPQRRPRVARRFHARDVAHVTASRAARAKATSIVRTRSPTPRRRWRRSAAIARSRATSSRATSRATTSPTTRGCSPRAGFTVRKRNAGRRLARRSAARVARNGARVAALVAPTWPRLRRRPRPGRSSCSSSTASRSTARAICPRSLRQHKPGDIGRRSRSSIATGTPTTATRRRWPRIRNRGRARRRALAAR